MSADSPRRSSGTRGIAVAATVPPQVVSDRSILDSAIGFINDVTLAHQPLTDPKDTITWARFESAADISDPRFGEDWELEGNVAPPLLLVLGYGLGVQVWAIPANGEAVEVLSWRHGIVSALRVLPTPASSTSIEEHERADELTDMYAEKRPLIALVDGSTSAGAQPQFCAVNFISLKSGSQVKTIKFKNPVLDVLANRSSIVITFHERIAVFDARTLEDRLSITTCYPSPGIHPNPVALGPRWLAYAENKLLHSKRSGAGCDGEGVASYTATVLNAAKSLGKGLRELGEQVAAGLTGTTGSGNTSKSSSFESGSGPDLKQAGVVTILDIKHSIKDYSPTSGTPMNAQPGSDPIIAHFIAHSEALVAMEFDNSGMLLLTADRRGHDFHVFRIQPHSVGSSLAAVHHIYVLHRGDTSAKVQNIAFSLDSRWVAVSTLRGTTHVFPITPYGGPMGVRTHTSLHVVNKLSRFHRSAGLSADGRSSSPISHSESTTFVQSLQPYHNPTLPPFPRPTIVLPLAQLRQPLTLGSPPGSAGLNIGGKTVNTSSSGSSQRQRLSSLSDDNGKPLSVCAIFAKSRSWLLDPPNVAREAPHRMQRKAVDSLFVMAGHGALIQYDLDTKLASNVAKEKICDDTPIELEVAAKAQWNLGRRKDGSQELMPPLLLDNWLVKDRNSCMLTDSTRQYDDSDDRTESWLSQVEIITHAGPHRRLWMGPQFVFKTYNTPSGSNLSHVDAEAVEIGVVKSTTTATAAAIPLARCDRSSPLNMPLTATGRAAVPVLIESGSYSSIEQSPKLMDRFRHDHLDSDFSVAHGDNRLKEDLADAMRESPSVSAAQKDIGRLSSDAASSENIPFYDALTEHDHDNDTNDDDDDDQAFVSQRSSASVAALASALPNIYSYDTSSSYESLESLKYKQKVSIEKIVNPLGTVTTVTAGMSAEMKADILDEVVSQLSAEDCVIHENCDEALFRPVVAIFCDDNLRRNAEEETQKQKELCQPPEIIGNKLIVPVIAKEVDAELSRKEKEKTDAKVKQQRKDDAQNLQKRAEKSTTMEDSKENVVAAMVDAKQQQQIQQPAITTASKEAIKPKESSASDQLSKASKSTGSSKTEKIAVKVEPTMKMKSKNKVEVEVEEKPNETTIKEQKSNDKLTGTSNEKSEIKPQLSKQSKGMEENKQSVISASAKCVKDSKVTPKVSLNTANENIRSSTITHTATIVEKKPIADEELKLTLPKPNVTTKLIEPQEKIESSSTEETEETLKKTDNQKDNGNVQQTTVVEKTQAQVKATAKIDSQSKTQKPKGSTEIIAEPVKSTKSKKVKQSISASSSDSEDVIEVISKRKIVKENEKKASLSSDESSFGDLSSSYLESKSKDVSSMSLSFSKTKEKTDVAVMKKSEETKPDMETMEPKTKEIEKNKSMKTQAASDTEKDIQKSSESKIVAAEHPPTSGKKGIESKKEATKVKTEMKTEITTKSNITTADKSEIASEKQVSSISTSDIKIVNVQKDSAETNKIKAVNKASEMKAAQECEAKKLTIDKEYKVTVIETQECAKPKSTPPPPKSPKKGSKQSTKCDTEITEATPITIAASQPNSPNKKAATTSKSGQSKEKKQLSENEPEPTSLKSEQLRESVVVKSEQKINLKASAKTSATTDEVDGEHTKLKTKLDDGKANEKSAPPSLTTSTPSVWKTLSGAEMISKNLEKSKPSECNFPSLGMITKTKKGGKLALDEVKDTTEISSHKLLPEIPTPLKSIDDFSETFGLGKTSKKLKKIPTSDFPFLKPLDALPPLPVLEPLEMIASTSSIDDKGRTLRDSKDVSLINFESPLQENPALDRKITPPPRGFTEQNLILALCGSLHYENENTKSDKIEFSPTLSLTRSNSGLGEQSVGDYKSLTENDEPYMSLEQSSQDTNTTNTATTNEKFSSSPNSSASEDIIITEEKKMTKKQRRKKQQMELESQKEKACAIATIDVDDEEELRPLIGGMSDSIIETYTDNGGKTDEPSSSASYAAAVSSSVRLLIDDNYSGLKPVSSSLSTQLGNSTTTEDSEGPMPATTSDDNIIVLPSTTTKATIQHKLKTKKLEHKINLIAAIEAATSSSTSSAEESGVETGRRSPDLDIGSCGAGALISVAATPVLPLPHQMASVAIQQNATKKKTKRRKR